MINEQTKKEMSEIFDNLTPENADHFLELLRFTLRGEEVMKKKLTHTNTSKEHSSSMLGD